MQTTRKTIFLVRHCHDLSTDNMDQESAARVPLSSYGIKQAHALARFMCSHNVTVVYSSVFERARQTGEIIHKKTGGDFKMDERFNEQTLARAKLDQKTAKEIKRRMLENPTHVPEGGQSLSQSIGAFLQALDDVLRGEHQNICIVSHGFLMEAALHRSLGLPVAPKFAEGSVAILTAQDGVLQLTQYNIQPFILLRIQNKLVHLIGKWFPQAGKFLPSHV